MKARIKGTNDLFVEIKDVSFIDEPHIVYSADKIEFEQEPTSDHWQEPCKLNPEKDLRNLIDHWQDVRERAAIAAMQGLLEHSGDAYTESYIARTALIYADALVDKLKGG